MTRFLTVPAILLIFLGTLFAQVPGASQTGSMLPSGSAQAGGAVNVQSPLLGGIPTGEPTREILPLSLSDALNRGLRYNLGAFLSQQTVRATRGARMLALSELLPKLNASLSEQQQQVNTAAFGFPPEIFGPFSVFDVRASVDQRVLDFVARNRHRASVQNVKAAEFDNVNTRDLVVYVCANLYLQAIASRSRIEATRAQVRTAQTLYDLALDQKAAGVSPGIEVLRAQVELQAQQQRLIVAEDQFAKDKLALARAIGLPLGQEFNLTEELSYLPLPSMSLDETVQRAYKERPDFKSAQVRVQSAESEWKAARAGRLPTLNLTADYGDIGRRPWESHGTFAVATTLRIPLFLGGSVRGRVLEADAVLQQRKAELEDLRGRVYYDVRNAFLDLKAAADRVQVAQSAVQLADEQVLQSQDRFRAGVTNNVEVVQAQQAQATANENLISSLQAHSAAKLALARAMGISGTEYDRFLRGQ